MLVDNTLMLECAILVVVILASYDMDCAHLIPEQIHEATLKKAISIPFPYLIYRLCLVSWWRFDITWTGY